jgi:hypothetical protein
MTNWTEEYWDYNGVSLNDYAFAVTAVDQGMPNRIGGNRVISYKQGSQFRRKFFAERVISLSILTQDRDSSDTVPASDQAGREQLNDNVDTLKALFSNTRELKTLTQRVRTSSGLVTRSAQAEPVNLRTFTRSQDFKVVRFVVDFLIPGVYLFGNSAATQNIAAKDTPTSISNDGHADATNLTIVVTGGTGGAVNPVLTNSDLTISFTYTGTIALNDTVTFDVDAGTATHSASGDVTTSVTHAGDRSWMLLAPGAQDLELTMDSGAGSVTIDYSPPYF